MSSADFFIIITQSKNAVWKKPKNTLQQFFPHGSLLFTAKAAAECPVPGHRIQHILQQFFIYKLFFNILLSRSLFFFCCWFQNFHTEADLLIFAIKIDNFCSNDLAYR